MWVETSAEIYSVIYARHKKDLVVHSSFTDSTGNGYEYSNGKPTIITEWCFKNSDTPLIKAFSEKESELDKEYDTKYFIYLHKNPIDND